MKLLTLTRRQAEVMEWVCLGKTNGEIGLILGVSECTAKNHVAACRRKLGANNKTLAVSRYLCPERFRR
jgi:DNA-binding CsgD family transcriptional regulator